MGENSCQCGKEELTLNSSVGSTNSSMIIINKNNSCSISMYILRKSVQKIFSSPILLLPCLFLVVFFNFSVFFPPGDGTKNNIRMTTTKQQVVSAKQKQIGQSQIQLSHASYRNRYPDEYIAVKEYFDTKKKKKKKESQRSLLSFGSSTGEEALTLATMYFNDTNFVVFGVDLDQNSIEKAKASAVAQDPKLEDSKVTFFNGQEDDISEYGPYDAIFANSVLCYHGKGVSPTSIVEKFPFSAFESSLGYLDANLNVGGVLAIVNTNYHFSHAKDLYKKYRPISKCSGNFVPKVYLKENVTPAYETLAAVLDCVWVKEHS